MHRTSARDADIDLVARTVTLAFASDPVWSVALARRDAGTDHHGPYWRLYVEGAVAHGTVSWPTAGRRYRCGVAAGSERTRRSAGSATRCAARGRLGAGGRRGDARALGALRGEPRRRPREARLPELLATHRTTAGVGIGQQLLAADLAAWDERSIPAYLESTNPANDHRYARTGFAPVGPFRAVRDDAIVTSMWRPVGG